MTTKTITVLLVLISGAMTILDFNAIGRPLQEEALDLNKIISGMISNIPDRIRKISSGNKLDVVSLQRDEDARDQLRKLVVY